MVIVGILGGAIGFTAFQFIGQIPRNGARGEHQNRRRSRPKYPRSQPESQGLDAADDIVTGALRYGADLASLATSPGSPGNRRPGRPTGGSSPTDDGVETVHIQMIAEDTAATAQGDGDRRTLMLPR